MSEREPIHVLLASDDYWGEPRPEPKLPIEKAFLDQIASDRFASLGAATVQGLFKKAFSEGHIIFPVHEGNDLPLLERGVGLMRIVDDIRQAPVSQSVLARWWNKGRVEDTPESFDTSAKQMVSDKLYTGNTARLTLPLENSDEQMRIWRQVHYVTGSKTGVMLEGVHSAQLSSNPNNAMMNYLIPPLAVGETYKYGLGRATVRKVIAADILIAGGKRAKAPRKSFFVTSLRPALNP